MQKTTNSELQIKIKNNKIYSHIRKKWLVKNPEELVRQSYLLVLVNQYGYSIDQMDEEINVTGRGSGNARADFVIWKTIEDKMKSKTPIIIVECKSDNVTISKEDYGQGENYARIVNAPFFGTHNNKETKFWRIKKDRMPGYIEEIEDIPKVSATDKQIEELLKKLKVFKENEFADLLHLCHNIIRNREKLDPAAAFDEIAKILFMKVYAERNLQANMKNNIFSLEWVEDAEKYTKNYLATTFKDTIKEFGKDKIFSEDEKINLRDNTIKSIIAKLEKYNLSATSTDVKGIAFERFLGKTFRGEIGQFFTPRPIVEFMVQMVEPKEGDIICDPASGSGGFLIRFYEIVRDQIYREMDESYQKAKSELEKDANVSEEEKAKQLMKIYESSQKELDIQRKDSKLWELANRSIYGCDANDRMARTSKMNMIMHGDGHGGIHHHDGFLNVNGIFEGRFDVVLTNPPFGQNVEKEDTVVETQIDTDDEAVAEYKKLYGDSYDESQQKIKAARGKPILSLFRLPKTNSIKTEILFIERCLSLLKPGGRLGIVLPEGILNNPSLVYVRDFTEDQARLLAIISIPQEAFISAKAFVKTSLLFLRKFTDEEKQRWDTLVEAKKIAILTIQQGERGKLGKSKEDKKRIKELDAHVEKEARRLAHIDFNYPICMAEAEHVGITSTGETGDNVPNELTKILAEFKDPQRNSLKYRSEK